MAAARKKSLFNSKTGEINLATMTATTEQARVFVNITSHPVRRKYIIPVTSSTKKTKNKSENFFKRLFKSMTESIGLK
jgi:hypothetical protein